MSSILWTHFQVGDQRHFNDELDVAGGDETATNAAVTTWVITIARMSLADASVEAL
ncbi:MAG: hypothetical protein ACF8AM_14065 [Rhodopirellula sp. JB055]|uniref:hypothetical protein n=1 Tax=Rhodopirellula sp. JB055 TaxID=3342846 RepID=UPI00370A7507